jgi:hypothetical protein
MLPTFSRREPPTGHLLASSLFDLLWSQFKTRLLPGSKTESIIVARNDKEPEVIAAYTVDSCVSCYSSSRVLVGEHLRTLETGKSHVGPEASIHSNLYLKWIVSC